MSTTIDERKYGKYVELSNKYKESLNGPITITYDTDLSIDLAGNNTIGDFHAVILACEADNPTLTAEELALVTVRIRDMYKITHNVTYTQLKTIIAMGCSVGNALWNKKVDLQEECYNIDVSASGVYTTEEEAMAAIAAITW